MMVSPNSLVNFSNLLRVYSGFEGRFFLLITFLVIVFDQLSKYLIELTLPSINFLFFTITYSTNTGAGFGILQGNSFWLGIISLVAAVLMLVIFTKLPKSNYYSILMGLLLGGTIGNGIDRLVKQYVVDFIATPFWPSFNVADSAISIAAVGFIVLMIKEEISLRKN